jgi:hypothetical protein
MKSLSFTCSALILAATGVTAAVVGTYASIVTLASLLILFKKNDKHQIPLLLSSHPQGSLEVRLSRILSRQN